MNEDIAANGNVKTALNSTSGKFFYDDSFLFFNT